MSITWTGVFPALTTKFTADDTLDLPLFEKNLQAQLTAGVNGIVLGGTLGEASVLSTIEKEKIALEKRTIDFVGTGEQQPETDHAMQKENSNSGNTNHEFFRDANRGGFFSYEMKTNSESDLSLIVRYWGAEWGSRK